MNFGLNFRQNLAGLWLSGGGGGGQSGASDGGCAAVPGGGRFHRPSRRGPEGVEKEETGIGQEDARELLWTELSFGFRQKFRMEACSVCLNGLKSVFEDTRLSSR